MLLKPFIKPLCVQPKLHKLICIMADQKKISNFFQPLGNKRANVDKDPVLAKKAKPDSTSAKDDENKNAAVTTSTEEVKSDRPPQLQLSQDVVDELKQLESKTHGVVTNIGETWFKALKPEFQKPYFPKLCEFVSKERKSATIYPPSNEVFSWTRVCPIREVKVVILGQDPYHGPNQAHGLCFSVQAGVAIPPSLKNMYKELEADIDDFNKPDHGYLMGWAQQGVLLLNACLTVQAHQANSHKDQGWEKLTDSVIAWINHNLEGVVFMLWGAYAHKKGAHINKKRHHLLKSVHPSPLSAHRGFLGCKHFSQCNKLLTDQNKKPIDWTHLPTQQ